MNLKLEQNTGRGNGRRRRSLLNGQIKPAKRAHPFGRTQEAKGERR
jgi:hypothetical protein